MTGRRPVLNRDEALADVRATYRRYHEHGRDRLWDVSNPGYARMIADRDTALVRLVVDALPPAGSVLDVGCGVGDMAELVRAKVGDVSWTGVDLLREAVVQAHKRRPWARWIEASVDVLPLRDAEFDVVLASTLFSSLPTSALEESAAAEVARVLKPGGWLVWYDLRYDNPRNPDVHGIGRDGLARLFPEWELELRSMTLLPPVARRLGRLTPVVYPLLEAIPPLRSHLVGRLRRHSTP